MNGLCWIKYIAKRMKDQLQLSFFWQGLSFPRGSIFHSINWLCIPSKTLWYLSTHTVYDSCHSNTNFTIYCINFPLDSYVFPLFRDCHVTIFGCYHIVNNLKVALGVSPQFISIWTRVLNHNKYVEIKQFSKEDIKQNNISTFILLIKFLVYQWDPRHLQGSRVVYIFIYTLYSCSI